MDFKEFFMNKKILLAFSAILLSSTLSQAMMMPSYFNLKKIDAAVEEVATNFLNYEDIDEAPIASIEVKSGEQGVTLVTVGMGNNVCTVKIMSKAMPAGLAGSPGLDAKITGACEVIREDLKTAKYEKVAAKMDQAAKLGKMIEKVVITSKGAVKVISKK
jgi:hypothetical protein